LELPSPPTNSDLLRTPAPSPAPAGNEVTSLAGGQAALVAEIDAIAKKLAQDPKNKEALDALDRAVKELKRLNGPKPRSDDPTLQKR
jgi:hypothetical protein